MPQFYSRSEWGARPPRSVVRVDQSQRRYAFLHHSTGDELSTRRDSLPEIKAWVREIQRYHMDQKGWSDIAYSFLVDRFGNVYEGRGWEASGGHTTGYNTTGHGICFLGDGNDIDADDVGPVLNAIASLLEEADERAGRPLIRKPHRAVRQTNCPGDFLAAWVESSLPVPNYNEDTLMAFTKQDLIDAARIGAAEALKAAHLGPNEGLDKQVKELRRNDREQTALLQEIEAELPEPAEEPTE